MATDKTKIIPSELFEERLVAAVERLAGRENLTTVVQPRALDPKATDAAKAYAVIAASLRTVFEPLADNASDAK